MPIDINRCSIIIMLSLSMAQGSPVSSIGNANHEALAKADFRQAKSEEMSRYMNATADPCEDFYAFACGNYAEYNSNEIFGASTMPSLHTLREIVDARLKAELETEDAASDTDVDRKLKMFYKSCLNVPSILNETKSTRREIIKQFGQMPALVGDKWQEDDFDWVKTVAEIVHQIGLSTIFSISAVTDFNDNTIKRVGVSEPKFTQSAINLYSQEAYRDHRFSYTFMAAYQIIALLGLEPDVAMQTAQEIVDFEIVLAQGKVDKHLGRLNCEIYTLTTIDEMQNKYLPELDTKKLLGSALDFTPNELYVDHQYVEMALNAIKNTPKRVVANYIYYMYFTDTYLLPAVDDSSDVDMMCVSAVQSKFYKQLDNMMYRKHVNHQMKESVFFLWKELKASFQAALQSPRLSWIQEDTRNYALDKLEAMRFTILSFEDNNFEQEFSTWHPNDQDHLSNLISLAALHGNRTRAEMHEPVQPEDEGVGASYVPSYSPIDNLIKIPVGFLLEYHRYASSYPNAINFGTLGSFIGHEMLHGFDDAGRKYDAKGNSRNWWDPHSVAEFSERTKCFISQYQKYTLGGKALPKMQLQAENISDNGGIRAAYAAYLKWHEQALSAKQNLELESLPGLNYTNKQLFFIGYGQSWCLDYEPDISTVASDIHVPPKCRVIGTLSNFEEFAKEFNCPHGSPMNPVDKCEIY